MAAAASGFPSPFGDRPNGVGPKELRGYAEIASALAVVAQASLVRGEISNALGIEDATPSDLYQLFVRELPPFASVYLSGDGNIGGESHSAIAGFYHALGVPTPSDPDHLSSLFSLLSQILQKEADLTKGSSDPAREAKLASVSRAKSVLVGEHLLSWLPAYLLRAKEVVSYRLSGWVNCAMDLLSVLVDQISQSEIGEEEFEFERFGSVSDAVEWITTPRKSGLVITPWDISNIGDDLGVALRVGRKRFVLEELLNQSRSDVALALQVLSDHQMKLFNAHKREFPSLSIWAERAARTRELIASYALLCANSSRVSGAEDSVTAR